MDSEDPVQKTPGNIEVLKHFIFVNKNCKSAKHVLKLDQGSDESSSSQKGRTQAFGGALGGSASGTTPASVNLKYDYIRSNTITTSNVDKVLHSWSMEIEVPPNHSCSIKVTSKTFTSTVQYSGWLTRQYGISDVRTTSVSGTYENQEAADLESVYNCKAEKEKLLIHSDTNSNDGVGFTVSISSKRICFGSRKQRLLDMNNTNSSSFRYKAGIMQIIYKPTQSSD
ncbi:Natterin-4 [Anabarilius grahami]|uniref:Natterin-4 n=1 Tax=Anabarilius grahami TaxID=495550 RepID=A0A3N0Y4R9_ANAGA|nr:Natterin-4 [Anabarilius grahami]